MGTTVHCKSYLPGYYSMKDLNEDSNRSGWPLFYGDKTSISGQYYNDSLLHTVTDAYPGYAKDALKQIMLEHEAIFKNQVHELHRLYRTQRDMMEEVKRSVLHQQRIPIETSSSSIPSTSQKPSEDARKWQTPIFPLASSISGKQSIPGADIVNSSPSCTKINKTIAGPSPLQNGCSSKDYEMFESRPSKVRKKLFDLQLPADEYIDTEEGEQSQDIKLPGTPIHLPNGNHKVAPESGAKFFLGGGVKIDRQEAALGSGSCLRSSMRLADLNAPIQAEEETAPAAVEFLGRAPCHGESKVPYVCHKSESQFIGLPKNVLQNPHHGSSNGTLNDIRVENRGNGRECLSYMFEAGHNTGNLNPFSQGPQPDKLPLPFQPRFFTPNNACQSREILSTNHSKGDIRREGAFFGLENSERSRDTPNFNHMEPFVASHLPHPYQFVNASNLANAWSQSLPCWEKPSSSFTQKLTSVQTRPSLNSPVTLRSNLSSTESHETFGNKWLLSSSSRSNHGFRNSIPNQGEIYYGSSSVSKEETTRFPSVGFDYLNCNKDDNVASERMINYGSGNFFKGSNFVDLTSTEDKNVGLIFPKRSSNEVVPQQTLEIINGERKHWNHPEVLPWFRAKPSCGNEATNVRKDSNSVGPSFFLASNHLSNQSEMDKIPNQKSTQDFTSTSCAYDVGAKKNEIGDCLGNRRILGFPIFENPCTSKTELFSPVSKSASLRCHSLSEDFKHGGKKVVIDINVACDPAVSESSKHIDAEVLVEEKKLDIEVANCRNHIDLNISVIEDEVLFPHPVTNTAANVKIAVGIDLEAPALPEIEEDLPEVERKQHEQPLQFPADDRAEKTQDEVARIAAEAIVAISSSGRPDNTEDAACHPPEASLEDSLLWFVEVISSCGDDLESKLGTESRGRNGRDKKESPCREIDYFEAMTLSLVEIKEEEYMPQPLVPDNREAEEMGATSVNRSQKGPGRRGRQRRDFRKDILPGLASLSRHEVAEDLQTFGGLMRATGHPWNLGLTRRNSSRNGGGRGRRRSLPDPEPDLAPAVAGNALCTLLMQRLNNIEVRPEDTSLTGWGKTTRRPRRQRCPAGNPPSVPLT